jgi:nucleotide-binding universal stress UspA family protein
MDSTTMNTDPYVVLVGMDFSELADRALVEAFEIAARRDNAQLHVVSIVEPPTATADPSLSGFSLPMDGIDPLVRAFERLTAHVQARLEGFVAEATKNAGRVSGPVVSHVRMDSPGFGIAQLAADLKANLIVVGTHGRRGLARMLMGSVAETTVRYARCPVLVVPPIEEPAEIKIEPACPECLLTRADPKSHQMWCAQHRERHGRRHTYHQSDRGGTETNFPLTLK